MSTVDARPYRWPYHGGLIPGRTAILVCWDEVVGPGSREVAALRAVVERGRAAGMRVVHLPRGAAPALEPRPGDLVCARSGFGGFTATDLDLVLRGIRAADLLIAGFPLELGADCTMREANDLGYECLLLEDCCTGLSEQTRAGAISSIQMSGGIFGAVATAAGVLEAIADAR
jgi:isochorismate hydrolase